MFSVTEIMKREADAGAMTGSGGPTSPHKRYRQGDDELRLLIPSKVRFYHLFHKSHLAKPVQLEVRVDRSPGSFKIKFDDSNQKERLYKSYAEKPSNVVSNFRASVSSTFKFVLDENLAANRG